MIKIDFIMYNWIDGRKFSGSRNLPKINFISKNCMPFIKNAFELNSLNRLPVIKEEEGYASEDEMDVPHNYSESNLSSCLTQRTFSTRNPSTNSNKEDKLTGMKTTYTKLPPLINVNCLMNADIKQTQSLWDTKFGKRLIYGKSFHQDLSEVDDSCSSDFSSLSEKTEINIPSNIHSKAIFLQDDNNKNSTGGNKRHTNKIKGKKNRKINNCKQNSLKIKLEKKECESKSSTIIGIKSKDLSDTFSSLPQKTSSTASSLSRNQRFLTECVQTILDGCSSKIKCEYCNEIFSNIEELCKHKKQHESTKEVCLLCRKEFFNPNAFIKHLLTHEGVDCLSCKKCKKYFPSLKKYKQHYLDYHFTLSHTVYENKTNIEYLKKWLPKFECKRCKIEFESEEQQVAHRRNHIKNDLAGAYLLSLKNLTVD